MVCRVSGHTIWAMLRCGYFPETNAEDSGGTWCFLQRLHWWRYYLLLITWRAPGPSITGFQLTEEGRAKLSRSVRISRSPLLGAHHKQFAQSWQSESHREVSGSNQRESYKGVPGNCWVLPMINPKFRKSCPAVAPPSQEGCIIRLVKCLPGSFHFSEIASNLSICPSLI